MTGLGCSTFSQSEKFILPQGESIICQSYEQNKCGMKLKKCGKDESVDFDCMTSIHYMGPEISTK